MLVAIDEAEDEDELVVSPSLSSLGGVLCLIAFASCIDSGSTLNATAMVTSSSSFLSENGQKMKTRARMLY